jgi:hypothetical protein
VNYNTPDRVCAMGRHTSQPTSKVVVSEDEFFFFFSFYSFFLFYFFFFFSFPASLSFSSFSLFPLIHLRYLSSFSPPLSFSPLFPTLPPPFFFFPHPVSFALFLSYSLTFLPLISFFLFLLSLLSHFYSSSPLLSLFPSSSLFQMIKYQKIKCLAYYTMDFINKNKLRQKVQFQTISKSEKKNRPVVFATKETTIHFSQELLMMNNGEFGLPMA